MSNLHYFTVQGGLRVILMFQNTLQIYEHGFNADTQLFNIKVYKFYKKYLFIGILSAE